MIKFKKKPTIYLPLEIKAREFHSNLLLAAECCKLGFRVYIGDKEGIFWLLRNKRQKGGVFFYKAALDKYKAIVYPACDSICILDQEMGLAVNQLEENYNSRFPSSLNFDRYYLIGEKHRKIIEAKWPEASAKIRVTGWPKFDKENYNRSEDVKNPIVASEYILFASDFGYNCKENVDEGVRRTLLSNIPQENKDVIIKSIYQLHRKYVDFLDEVRSLKLYKNRIRIVIRPHPGEILSQWEADLKDVPCIDVIRTGEVAEWARGATLFVHRGSTTAVQSFLLGASVVALEPYYDEDRKDLLSYLVSHKAKSLQSVVDNLDHFRSKRNDVNLELFREEIFYDENQSASSRIAQDMLTLGVSNEGPIEINFFDRFAYIIRQSVGNFYRKHIYDKSEYKNSKKDFKIESGIRASEALDFYKSCGRYDLIVNDKIRNVLQIECE